MSVRRNRASAYQEGAEEDEGDKVVEGKVRATAVRIFLLRLWVALFPTQAGHHDRLPGLARGTPDEMRKIVSSKSLTVLQRKKVDLW